MAFAFDGSACPAKVFDRVSAVVFNWLACGVGESCHAIQQARSQLPESLIGSRNRATTTITSESPTGFSENKRPASQPKSKASLVVPLTSSLTVLFPQVEQEQKLKAVPEAAVVVAAKVAWSSLLPHWSASILT